MPSSRPIHPFNSAQKVFTDENSISLMLRLLSVFNRPDMEYVYHGSDFGPPVGVVDRNTHKLPYIVALTSGVEFTALVAKLEADPDVVAIFYHEGLNKRADGERMVYAIMKDDAAAARLAGGQG